MTAPAALQPRIACTETGTGEPVVLIHCSTASSKEWRSLCKVMGDDFRAVMPDQWGCGHSDPWTGNGAFDLGSEAAPVLEIMQNLGGPVHLVGHSYGGGVALRIARQRPDLVRSLTLIEPSAFHLLRHGDAAERDLFAEIAAIAASVADAVADGDYWSGMARFIDYWNGTGAWDNMPHDMRMAFCQRLGKVVLDFRALFEEPATLEDHAALSMPTLILCGDRSPAPSRRIVEMLLGTLPDARVARIAGAGHMSPLTHPEAVNAAIRDHLRRTSQRQPEKARAA